ncbi:hypothetical protein Y032_0352g3281 [Ancylostoma ceylanicum]|uniref:7TM GPCR serpentine receptor class x (Srx) domain-containing protein n=1 Tax=Ancylostoma ceylanicum TaxID=53326 RepID=A0A016RXN5_9BILA|nr:hypothetical protein Y032_0352g3281 [Ancylostoma ceylanicum]
MQRRFLIYLCIQASVPTFSLLGPMLIILIKKSAVGQEGGNLIFFFMAFHGLTSPLSVVFCNDAYRSYALAPLKLKCANTIQNPIATVSELSVRRSSAR